MGRMGGAGPKKGKESEMMQLKVKIWMPDDFGGGFTPFHGFFLDVAVDYASAAAVEGVLDAMPGVLALVDGPCRRYGTYDDVGSTLEKVLSAAGLETYLPTLANMGGRANIEIELLD